MGDGGEDIWMDGNEVDKEDGNTEKNGDKLEGMA